MAWINGGQVDQGTEEWSPVEELAEDHNTKPVPDRSTKEHVAKSDHVHREQKETVGKIKQILVEYQHLFLVLFGGHHGVQDKSVEDCSRKSDDDDNALKI